MMNFHDVLIVHCLATGLMTGIIWATQILIYPSFAKVNPEQFPEYHQFHMRQMSFIVIVPMVIEFITGIALFYFAEGVFLHVLLLNIALIVLTWAVTFMMSVPAHHRLSEQFRSDTLKELLFSNWLCTAMWSARAFICFYLLTL